MWKKGLCIEVGGKRHILDDVCRFLGQPLFLKPFGINNNLKLKFLNMMHFWPFAQRKTKRTIFQANIYEKSFIKNIFENVVVAHQLKAIEWISNCKFVTDITRLYFDILTTFFRILLVKMAIAYRPFSQNRKKISGNYNKNNNDVIKNYVK